MGAIKKIASVVKKIDPLRGGDAILEKAGLPTMTGEGNKNILDMGQADAAAQAAQAQKAQQEAADAQARIAQAQLDQQQQLNTINRNYAQDLSGENRTRVEAGGSAAAADAVASALKKRQGVGLASTLGINV